MTEREDHNMPSEFWTEWETTKKRERCVECRARITRRKGIPFPDLYLSVIGIWNGERRTYKWCLLCRAVDSYVVKSRDDITSIGRLLEFAEGKEGITPTRWETRRKRMRKVWRSLVKKTEEEDET